MGLDSVELVFSWKKAFQIAIPDQEAATLTTVEKATEVVMRYVTLQPKSTCISQQIFYALTFPLTSLFPTKAFSWKHRFIPCCPTNIVKRSGKKWPAGWDGNFLLYPKPISAMRHSKIGALSITHREAKPYSSIRLQT